MKNKILPIIAIVFVIIAVLVIVFIPKNGSEKEEENNVQKSISQGEAKEKSSSKLATLDEEGNVIIIADDVSEDKISFIKYSDESKIELIAIKGANGKINVALGTCQSCNGSPNAYYTQSGNLLQCHNCGLTFETDIIGIDGNGCHPILIDESGITRAENEIKINKEILLAKESLFANIKSH